MHQVIGLLSVLVTLTQAVPTPATNGIFLKYHSLSDAHDPKRVGVLQERSINLPSCFGSGASMKIDDLYAGIAVWCQRKSPFVFIVAEHCNYIPTEYLESSLIISLHIEQDGISVPMGKSLNVGYGGIFLANGGLGTFNGT